MFANGHDTQISINRQVVSGVNQLRSIRNSGHACNPVFPGDNGAMNEHAATALNNAG